MKRRIEPGVLLWRLAAVSAAAMLALAGCGGGDPPGTGGSLPQLAVLSQAKAARTGFQDYIVLLRDGAVTTGSDLAMATVAPSDQPNKVNSVTGMALKTASLICCKV